MLQVALSFGGTIILWAIIGLLFTIAVYITMNTFILPYFKVKKKRHKSGIRVLPSQVDVQIDQLRQQIDSLIYDIDQFISKSEPSLVDIPVGHGEVLINSHQQSDVQQTHNTDNLFDIKFSKRIKNILYFFRRRGIISEKEWKGMNRIMQPGHIDMDMVLSLLKEYRLRLK